MLSGEFIGDSRTVLWRNIVTGVQSSELHRPLDRGFDIIPNPVSGTSTIRIRNAQLVQGFNGGTLQVYNARGESVVTCQVGQVSIAEWDVKLPGLAPGVYFITLTFSNMIQTEKIIVLD